MKNKKQIFAKIANWNNKVIEYQKKKADLHSELLFIDIKLNEIMIEYDKSCKEFLNYEKENKKIS